MRIDGRSAESIRKVTIKNNFLKYAEGSCLIEVGNTKVICSASIEDGVPHFLRNSGQGWVTAEYGMLPRSCKTRTSRESSKGKVGGRTQEIQRLIGRSLRAVIDTKVLGERTVWIDCDVIQADGGTRAASITGAFVALAKALKSMQKSGLIDEMPIREYVACISVGIVNKELMLDLCFEEDSKADVDMNIVMTGGGKIVEVQGTAEKEPFSKQDLDKLIELASEGINELISVQKKTLGIT